MQITRQRVRPEMHISTVEKCPTCKGSGEVSPTIIFDEQIENQLAFFVNEKGLNNLVLKLHPYIAAFISKGFISKRIKWMFKYTCRIKVIPISSYQLLEFHFFDRNDIEIEL
jgi:ribonuclease G